MKKLFYIFVTFLIIISASITTALAQNSINTETENHLFDSNEFSKIKNVIEKENLIEKDILINESQEEPNGYKLYTISPDEFTETNIKSSVENEIKSENYNWIVIEKDKIIKVSKTEDKWSVSGYSSFENNAEKSEINILNSINNITEKNKIRSISVEEYVCFEIPQYHTSFIGIFSEGKSVVIPYGSRPDLTGLENGKEYSVKDANSILKNNFETNSLENNNGGGINKNEIKSNNTLFIMIIPAILVVSVLIIFFTSLKKKNYWQE